jgi:hypothetical protein
MAEQLALTRMVMKWINHVQLMHALLIAKANGVRGVDAMIHVVLTVSGSALSV